MVRATLALVALAAALPGCSDGTPVVVVTMRHSRFEPAAIEVPRGTAIRFVVRNLDPIDHELILGDAATQDRHERGTEPHHGEKPGEVSVPGNGEATTTYRFAGPGQLLYGCHLPGHWDYGMRGTVTVV